MTLLGHPEPGCPMINVILIPKEGKSARGRLADVVAQACLYTCSGFVIRQNIIDTNEITTPRLLLPDCTNSTLSFRQEFEKAAVLKNPVINPIT